jgi:hypothetical protein
MVTNYGVPSIWINHFKVKNKRQIAIVWECGCGGCDYFLKYFSLRNISK